MGQTLDKSSSYTTFFFSWDQYPRTGPGRGKQAYAPLPISAFVWIRIRIIWIDKLSKALLSAYLYVDGFGSAFFVCGSMASFLSESDTTGFFGSDWFQTGSVSRIQFTIPDPKHCYNIVLAFKMLLTPRYLCFHKLLRSRKTVESVSEPRVYTIHISIH